MSTENEVEIEVVNILEAGTCPYGHNVGDKYQYPEERGNICAAAFHSIYPYTLGMRIGSSFPWEEDSESVTVCCPDYKNPVVFKITRK
ncbi:MAG: TIGR04076 family protein [Candidatus Heimdallarchaeota archaeon]|nr:TIGR04076 family protein [Candidatus Heimdallarchaeota archaeon]MCK4769474.1 TIGR04076 family protein [Candidatus Heimdallarchaeota archaeon]